MGLYLVRLKETKEVFAVVYAFDEAELWYKVDCECFDPRRGGEYLKVRSTVDTFFEFDLAWTAFSNVGYNKYFGA